MESVFAHANRKKTLPAIFAIALGLSLFLSDRGLPDGLTDACAAESPTKSIVFLGDSLTAGFGVQPTEAFPALVAEKIRQLNKKVQVVLNKTEGLDTDIITADFYKLGFSEPFCIDRRLMVSSLK